MDNETAGLVDKTNKAEIELEKNAERNQNAGSQESRLINNKKTRVMVPIIEYDSRGQPIAYHHTSPHYNQRQR